MGKGTADAGHPCKQGLETEVIKIGGLHVVEQEWKFFTNKGMKQMPKDWHRFFLGKNRKETERTFQMTLMLNIWSSMTRSF